jgi:hypothetical protein
LPNQLAVPAWEDVVIVGAGCVSAEEEAGTHPIIIDMVRNNLINF